MHDLFFTHIWREREQDVPACLLHDYSLKGMLPIKILLPLSGAMIVGDVQMSAVEILRVFRGEEVGKWHL
jgi:hypothetical protein